jgi:hypothetical protein
MYREIGEHRSRQGPECLDVTVRPIVEFVSLRQRNVLRVARRALSAGYDTTPGNRRLSRESVLSWVSPEVDVELGGREEILDLAGCHVLDRNKSEIGVGFPKPSRPILPLARVVRDDVLTQFRTVCRCRTREVFWAQVVTQDGRRDLLTSQVLVRVETLCEMTELSHAAQRQLPRPYESPRSSEEIDELGLPTLPEIVVNGKPPHRNIGAFDAPQKRGCGLRHDYQIPDLIVQWRRGRVVSTVRFGCLERFIERVVGDTRVMAEGAQRIHKLMESLWASGRGIRTADCHPARDHASNLCRIVAADWSAAAAA